jgi:hypothetical protein
MVEILAMLFGKLLGFDEILSEELVLRDVKIEPLLTAFFPEIDDALCIGLINGFLRSTRDDGWRERDLHVMQDECETNVSGTFFENTRCKMISMGKQYWCESKDLVCTRCGHEDMRT